MDDLFGSSDSENEEDSLDDIEIFFNACFISLMHIRPHSRRSDRPAAYLNESSENTKNLLLPRIVAIVTSDDEMGKSLQAFLRRMELGGFVNTLVNPVRGSFDVIIHVPDDVATTEFVHGKAEKVKRICAQYARCLGDNICSSSNSEAGPSLVAGGTLLVQCPAGLALQDYFPDEQWFQAISATASSVTTYAVVQSESYAVDEVGSDVAVSARRRGVALNSTGAVYWAPADAKASAVRLAAERALLLQATVYVSVEECRLRVFADDSHRAATKALRTHGLVVLPALFDEEQVTKWGSAALNDFEEALHTLYASRSIDLLRPGSGPKIENFRELGMREALRCDIRNGRAMKKIAEEEEAAEKNAGCGAELHCRHLRNHPALQRVLTEVANPPHADLLVARGNWGRWNFEGSGPEAPPPPLKVSQVGGVMSLSGCADQTIHADTAHLYTHVTEHMPPAYFNLFVPALNHSPDGAAASFSVGQTAFVAGTHTLAACAKIMCEEGGQTALNASLLRPHLTTGDALIFDCRILHFGLANQTQPFEPLGPHADVDLAEVTSSSDSVKQESSTQREEGSLWNANPKSVCRPLLYINYTQPWFVDPKNWNDNDSIFS